MKLFILLFLVANLFAGSAPPVLLEHPELLRKDQQAIQRGALAFKERCVSCHALSLAGYAPILAEVGLTPELMPKHNLAAWQGHPPPDLSLVARTRGTDWVYTYMHSFYQDPKSTMGYNNLLLPNSAMPAVLSDLSGVYVLAKQPVPIIGVRHAKHWYAYLEQDKAGSLSPELYSYYVLDLVNFLDYVAEPYRAQREALGWKVLLFLVAFAVVAYKLYKAYWRKIT